MSTDIKLPFATFLYSVLTEYRSTLNGQPMSRKTWEEQVSRSHEAWHNARKPKRTAPLTEDQWMAKLKGDPFLKGVDFAKELAICQYWCRTHNAKCSRRRVENWMKKAAADAKVDNPGGVQSHAPLPDPGPVGWMEWTRENLPGWRRFSEERAGSPVPPWHKLESTERHAIRTQMKGGTP